MANIDKGFNVEIISLGDRTLITSGELDPRVSGYEAPDGSLFAYKNGAGSTLLIKTGVLDTGWITTSGSGIQPTSHMTLTGREAADQHPISAITGLQSGLNSKADTTHTHALSELQQSGAAANQVISWNGTAWTPTSLQSLNLDKVRNIYTGSILPVAGTTTYATNAVPLSTSGTALFTTTVTPTAVGSVFVLSFAPITGVGSNNRGVLIPLFVNGVFVNAAVGWQDSSRPTTTPLTSVVRPNTLSPVTFVVRAGITGGGGTWFVGQGNASAMSFGGTNPSFWTITEFVI